MRTQPAKKALKRGSSSKRWTCPKHIVIGPRVKQNDQTLHSHKIYLTDLGWLVLRRSSMFIEPTGPKTMRSGGVPCCSSRTDFRVAEHHIFLHTWHSSGARTACGSLL